VIIVGLLILFALIILGVIWYVAREGLKIINAIDRFEAELNDEPKLD
jgi:hypothetical protein